MNLPPTTSSCLNTFMTFLRALISTFFICNNAIIYNVNIQHLLLGTVLLVTHYMLWQHRGLREVLIFKMSKETNFFLNDVFIIDSVGMQLSFCF